ncbi:uncharacterized protein F4822DRAFT_439954 [Hypoxylon trugodes]|uniref:uncharacterized protein n=1 Tax=Hypoxylon trugodes TaxID=326681 RepID=UPI0021986967|nr:uncharacterized protein F4822DRAFT_439954 [Hypoxylon trugodes]KAI1394378.1 hypothetical protein F4822DRAFT_439954 [Hypoxylon trugodes]
MPHPIQRSACDRCHGQKLRCLRSGSSGACVRCTKAKAVCTWSPSLRCKRGLRFGILDSPLHGSEDAPNAPDSTDTMVLVDALHPFVHDNSEFGLSTNTFQQGSTLWPAPPVGDSASGSSPTLALSNNSPPHSIPQLQQQGSFSSWQDRFNQEWEMLSTDKQLHPKCNVSEEQPASPKEQSEELSNLPVAIFRELSDLNVELFSLSSAIPKPPKSTTQPLSWKDKDFAIDRTFRLSQKLIEALNKLYPRNTGNTAISSTSSPIREEHSETSFDQSSFLLVLSCYQRLIETYDDIFGNMQACLDRSTTTAPEDYVSMPSMKVGSFSLPNSSALQITLVLQLARHLLQRMGCIIKALDRSLVTTSDGANDLMSLTFKAVHTREADLIERINKLRNTLVSLDIL